MAKSKYEYVKQFERETVFLPHTWLVVRIDGQGFHRFTATHDFEKPNDLRALELMNRCARGVFDQVGGICFAYGESDEYSFVVHENSQYFNRREAKLVSSIVSLFTSLYVFYWPTVFPDRQLKYPPSFDGRIVCYPTEAILRDYLAWRQVDCHINNLYNTCFWTLVQSGKSTVDAERELMGTLSADKNEMLFTKFGINYNKLPSIFRKGSIIVRDYVEEEHTDKATGEIRKKRKMRTVVVHEDIIKNKFWEQRPHILGKK
ncbi:hypothetical protein H4R33_005136 [Dimargaris cristalligena]|uniref:tRNA(His) guanylyltransferase n=1 Tax=Dimargaris cristalligena TaxID=215637 RepID=A0A4V1J5V2_9FUNG|nr:hypothetical protein H4R33_005136 [Dimargaris cristalligena]RKP40349.1 Thg1 C terminal domain-containing protein [Dimargaris cristalligena]|eukprot:RKP40349.1 Thg1 C terminal domain-containing protein [Dimargaris cristalligena]